MFVIAGFIVGFDTEKGSMAAGMVDCIQAAAIPVWMIGLLTALPSTQLSRRLKARSVSSRSYPKMAINALPA